MHESLAQMQEFAWQDGYGGFTVSKSMVDKTIAYIEQQKRHHARTSFTDEFLDLLSRHGISASFDEVFGPYRPPSGRGT